MKQYHNNYVILGGPGFYEYAYADIIGMPNVVYFKNDSVGFNSLLSRLLLRANFHEKINKLIPTPFSRFVYPRLFPFSFKDKRPLVFVFFNCRYVLLNSSYVEYLKHKYPSAKFVLFFQDIVASNPSLNLNRYRRLFDLILSYDHGDCDKYGFEYYPTPYSRLFVPPNDSIEPFDVYFCGKAKNRYPTVLDAYRRCVEMGLSCRFFLFDLPVDLQIKGDGLVYEGSISYERNLQYIQKCRCILDVTQIGATGFTPRLWEAITLNKHILSNNPSIDNSIHLSNIHHLRDIHRIKDWIYRSPSISGENSIIKSPVEFINYLDSK